MDLEVKHDEPGRKYFAVVDGRESVCDYGPAGDKTLVFSHTYVPPELRGRGIAEELVRQALDDVRQRGYKVIPSCWFVRVYIDRHSQYQDLLA
jgi:predicted GNAT family acetyltransferase